MKIFHQKKDLDLFLSLAFLSMGIGLRILPHLPNFTPVGAIALFGGVYLRKRFALVLPVLALFFSDWLIGFYKPLLMIAVYGSFLLAVQFGFWLKKHKRWYTIGVSAIVSAVLFYLITNFAFWAFTSWYGKTFSGLILCYTAAIPFFRNTLMGNLFYVPLFFGTYEIVRVLVRQKFFYLTGICAK